MDGRDIMLKYRGTYDPRYYKKLKPGEVRSTGAVGNAGGHYVEDNDFILDIPRLDPGAVRRREDGPLNLGTKVGGVGKKSGGQ